MKVSVLGGGVAGLTLAYALARRGVEVSVHEARRQIAGSASWQAGGMLAPWCEAESADRTVIELGRSAADWWDAALPGHVIRNGTLVVAPVRDTAELDRFAARTAQFERLDADGIEALEPDLAGRFRRGLLFADEAHLDPRAALSALAERLVGMGIRFRFGDASVPAGGDLIADCTGIAAAAPGPRGVRGEMLLLRCREVSLARPVRLLHPRFPIYVVPRADHLFMVGATMVESDHGGPISARSTMELLNAAYALHPAFGEAEVVETGVGVRPAYPDNLPRVEREGRTIRINGLYRHGFLLGPAMAERAAGMVCADQEIARCA